MSRITLASFGLPCLVLTLSFTPGCNNVPGDEFDPTRSHTMEEAHASAMRVSGDAESAFATCAAIGYDADGDGVDDTFAFIIGKDEDGDTFAVEPTNLADITADGEYGCTFDLLDMYVQISNYSQVGLDCVDTEGAVNPSAAEVCDGVDNDCNSAVDETGGASTWYQDGDRDGYGNAAISSTACEQPDGYVEDSTDCDDAVGTTFPGAPEMCDMVDNDCDGTTDESGSLGESSWYPDVDADGYGDISAAATVSCTAPSGSVADNGDCNDAEAGINPGATEVADDGIDNNCDGTEAHSQVCVEADDPADWCALYISDYTVFPHTPDDPSWYPNAYVGDTGTLCTDDFTVVSGHEIKLNLQCVDSIYGYTYWGWERGGFTNVYSVVLAGTDVTSSVVNTPYDSTGDGVDDGADGIVLAP